jgi:hypothetical protein
LPCLLIVSDPRESAAQLDGRGKLAAPIERCADRRGLFLGHSKHWPSVRMTTADGK